MAIANTLEFIEQAVDVVSDLVPMTKGQRKQLNKIITATEKPRARIKQWSRSAPLNSKDGFGKAIVTHPGISRGQAAAVANNMLISRSKPRLVSSKGTITIMHKELVGMVVNSATLSLTTNSNGVSNYQVNATSSTAFPWLSNIASAYDMYRFKRLRLVYVPLCATSSVGRVMVGYDPDSTDPIPLDRQALSNYACSSEGSVWGTVSLDVKLPDNQKWYYTEGATAAASTSSAFFDQGQFFCATWAGTDNQNVGELYALYEVELKDPQAPSSLMDRAYGNGVTVVSQFPYRAPVSMLSTATSMVITFGGTGTFFINTVCATTVGDPAPAATVSTGATILGGSRTANANTAQYTYIVNVTVPNATWTAAGLTALGHYTAYVTRGSYMSDGVYYY